MKQLWDEIEKLREVVAELGPDDDDDESPFERLRRVHESCTRQRPTLTVIQGGCDAR